MCEGKPLTMHAISHGRIPDELKAVIKLERLEHLHTYEVVAE